jgi:hypothetical protein
VAVSNDVLGGVVIGGSGTIAAAQVSMYWLVFNCYYVFDIWSGRVSSVGGGGNSGGNEISIFKDNSKGDKKLSGKKKIVCIFSFI